MCQECYVNENRSTPMRNPLECLQNHTQYICGTCGRCICIEHDPNRNLQRWNFPFQTLEIAKRYLRTADFTMKKNCGIYEIQNAKGRSSYKIFAEESDLQEYLQKNRDKHCERMAPVFQMKTYQEYEATRVRRLSSDEITCYMAEKLEQDTGKL